MPDDDADDDDVDDEGGLFGADRGGVKMLGFLLDTAEKHQIQTHTAQMEPQIELTFDKKR